MSLKCLVKCLEISNILNSGDMKREEEFLEEEVESIPNRPTLTVQP